MWMLIQVQRTLARNQHFRDTTFSSRYLIISSANGAAKQRHTTVVDSCGCNSSKTFASSPLSQACWEKKNWKFDPTKSLFLMESQWLTLNFRCLGTLPFPWGKKSVPKTPASSRRNRRFWQATARKKWRKGNSSPLNKTNSWANYYNLDLPPTQ